MRAALADLAQVTDRGQMVQLAYVNPETGRECMPILGFSAIMLRAGETVSPAKRSASCVYPRDRGRRRSRDRRRDAEVHQERHDRRADVYEDQNRQRLVEGADHLFQIDDAPMRRSEAGVLDGLSAVIAG